MFNKKISNQDGEGVQKPKTLANEKYNQDENPTYRLEDKLGCLLGSLSQRTKRWKAREEKESEIFKSLNLRDATSE